MKIVDKSFWSTRRGIPPETPIDVYIQRLGQPEIYNEDIGSAIADAQRALNQGPHRTIDIADRHY